ncbi:hypothetical protein [Bradyrhizobium sp. LA2.1]|uniref:hypothetical protein n=1 Tax=Bradyrhizobium sp. LA2.1 TaxID=3156376 RepID=UPI003390B3A8
MRRAIVVVLTTLLACSPVAADWSITSYKDRLSDRDVKVATLPAKERDHGVFARLVINCLESPVVGGLVLSIETGSRFSRGRMGLSYRVDQREVVPRLMPVNSNGNGMSSWAQPEELEGAKRIRVELSPARSPTLFFDFDLTGVDKAMNAIPCVRTREKWTP